MSSTKRIAAAFASLALIAAAISSPSPLAAQEKQPKWKLDPYTKNKPEALKRAGYVSFGPFPCGGKGAGVAQTTDIEKTIPYSQIRWIETAHFRIGVELPEWTVPMDPQTRAKIRGELERLATRLDGVDPKTRKLDPWLRAHLYAQRCEDLYAEFRTMAGVKDEDFPQDPKNVVKTECCHRVGSGCCSQISGSLATAYSTSKCAACSGSSVTDAPRMVGCQSESVIGRNIVAMRAISEVHACLRSCSRA